jgi:pyrimidine deaminase RibD-like protein
MAYKVAGKSTHRNHQLGAVVVRGGSVISFACNHAQWKKHAEVRALRPHMDLEGATLYVVRRNWRCSRPCAMCCSFIKESGVLTIVFIDENHLPRKASAHGF